MTTNTARTARLPARVIETPLGWVAAVVRDGALLRLSLPVTTRAAALAELPKAADATAADALLDRLARDLPRALAGESVDFSGYQVDLSDVPAFTRAALLATWAIPRGELRSYQWVADHAGNAKASRAAGQAMHHNPLPLVLPCHRVVGSNGRLTGYGGGVEMKRALLALEGASIWDC